MGEGATAPPSQEGKTNRPEDKKDSVETDIEARI
jgi:hypothetical protein